MLALNLALALACAAAAAAPDGWLDLRGQKVPEIVVDEWLNVEGTAELEGKVWLLEFFATW